MIGPYLYSGAKTSPIGSASPRVSSAFGRMTNDPLPAPPKKTRLLAVATGQVAELTTETEDVEVAVIPPHPFLVPVAEQVSEGRSHGESSCVRTRADRVLCQRTALSSGNQVSGGILELDSKAVRSCFSR